MKTTLGALLLAVAMGAMAHEPQAWRVETAEVCNGDECTVSDGYRRISSDNRRPRFADEESCRATHEYLLREEAVQEHEGRTLEFRRKAVEAKLDGDVLSISVVCALEPPCSEVGLWSTKDWDDQSRCIDERRRRFREHYHTPPYAPPHADD